MSEALLQDGDQWQPPAAPRLHELSLAAKWLTRSRWRRATDAQAAALAPMVDDIYERAAGLQGEVDPQVRPMLEALMPSTETRLAIARGLVEQRWIEEFNANVDGALWDIAAPVLHWIHPIRYAVRVPRREVRKALDPLFPIPTQAAKNLRPFGRRSA